MLRFSLLLSCLLCYACLLPLTCLPAYSDPALQPASAIAQPALDLLPLKKALSALDGTAPLHSHTTIRMTGTRAGVSVMLREDIQIVCKYPNRFHAVLTQYDSSGGPQKKLVVISNGARVWTYRPGLAEYSVTSFAAWKQTDNGIPTLGLVIGGFYLGAGRPLMQAFHSITPANNAEVQTALQQMEITLSRQVKSASGQDAYVYSLTLAKQDLAYQFYVGSQTNALVRVDLIGTQGNIQFFYREDVTRIAPDTAVSASTFAFVPLAGSRQDHRRFTKPIRKPHLLP